MSEKFTKQNSTLYFYLRLVLFMTCAMWPLVLPKMSAMMWWLKILTRSTVTMSTSMSARSAQPGPQLLAHCSLGQNHTLQMQGGRGTSAPCLTHTSLSCGNFLLAPLISFKPINICCPTGCSIVVFLHEVFLPSISSLLSCWGKGVINRSISWNKTFALFQFPFVWNSVKSQLSSHMHNCLCACVFLFLLTLRDVSFYENRILQVRQLGSRLQDCGWWRKGQESRVNSQESRCRFPNSS